MKNLIYKIKSKLFKYSKEGKKLIRPTYNELIEYQNSIKDDLIDKIINEIIIYLNS